MLLLDTHTLVWLSEGNLSLGAKSLNLIDNTLQQDELYVSSISFWEVAMLVNKGRIEMLTSVESWRKSLLNSGLQEISLTGEIAIESAQLIGFHGDPADRIITATAIHSGMSLCTADQKILGWKQKLTTVDARI